MKISLRGEFVALVDDCDADIAHQGWRLMRGGRGLWYACRGSKTVPKTVSMHRIILERILGRSLNTGEYCDHINGNGLDNRRANLRLATSSQNGANRRRASNNSSGYKGVSWNRVTGKWQAMIRVNKRQINLGSYATPEAAHQAYCEAAQKHFGEFARFN